MDLNNQSIGSPITEELSVLLKEYTDSNDRADVALKTNVGTSTIRDVVYRINSLSKNNWIAIKELTIRALKNCSQQIKDGESNIKHLEGYLLVDETKQVKAS